MSRAIKVAEKVKLARLEEFLDPASRPDRIGLHEYATWARREYDVPLKSIGRLKDKYYNFALHTANGDDERRQADKTTMLVLYEEDCAQLKAMKASRAKEKRKAQEREQQEEQLELLGLALWEEQEQKQQEEQLELLGLALWEEQEQKQQEQEREHQHQEYQDKQLLCQKHNLDESIEERISRKKEINHLVGNGDHSCDLKLPRFCFNETDISLELMNARKEFLALQARLTEIWDLLI
ncbi:hypothetical protein B0O80DRAFT_170323 [Mortierella sp. GBAus27b]|nr:hypothetical protein B0O80DRAFT_170323 [Mortierella sp. GBAus27b]